MKILGGDTHVGYVVVARYDEHSHAIFGPYLDAKAAEEYVHYANMYAEGVFEVVPLLTPAILEH